jgi:hypothetical protein
MSKSKKANRSIRVLTSLFVPEAATDLPEPIAAALRSHVANTLVAEVHILTESNATDVTRLISAVADAGKFTVLRRKNRPSFAEIFAYASELFERNSAPIAIMNADVSFAAKDDIVRASTALEAASRRFGKAVLALTRHDRVDGEWKLALRQSDGLPNTLSADCWVLSGPIDLPEADFYCLGHMNCDLMIGYDLVSAGYQVFNPCLDVRVVHHEKEGKDVDFYASANEHEDNHERFLLHTFARCNEPFVAYGFNWLRADWISAGNMPSPISSRRKKIYVLLPSHDALGIAVEILSLEIFAQHQQCDLVLLHEENAPELHHHIQPLFAKSRFVYLQSTAGSLDEFVKGVLKRGLENAGSVGVSSNSAFCREEIAKVADVMVVDSRTTRNAKAHGIPVTTGKDARYWLNKRHGITGSPPGLEARESTCTLITSLFRSEAYIDKFLRNSSSIYGYDEKVDHLFFVSDLSQAAASSLASHLSRHPNSFALWNRRDPGLYACWNKGLRMSCTWYVSNANVDDLRDPLQIWKLIDVLEQRSDLCVAASALVPFEDHAKAEVETLDKSKPWYTDQAGDFTYEHLARVSDDADGIKHLEPHNLPHCMPVWRRSLHDKHGYFDEERYGTFADWAFWLHVFRRGGKGNLLPESLSFYFVNPASHNRRGEQLAQWHHRIEQEHLESFCLRLNNQHVVGKHANRPAWQKVEKAEGEVAPKLDLHGRDYAYGQHRNSFNTIIEHLEPLHKGEDGVLFLPFIERYFVWGDADGEASSENPRPIDRDWIGILHSPFDAPLWFEPNISPENIFRTPLWQNSFPRCRGLITLSKDLGDDLRLQYPDLPMHSLLHPTAFEGKQFDMQAYLQRPRVVQAGDWLRKLQAIYQLEAPNHEKVMLIKLWTHAFMEREIAAIGDFRNNSVVEKQFVSNEDYDELLSSSVVLCLLYASAANNLVLECLVRHTPIMITPLPSVVEYLGRTYPLYVRDVYEAERKLTDESLIAESSAYLRHRCVAMDLSYERFASDLAMSHFYNCI